MIYSPYHNCFCYVWQKKKLKVMGDWTADLLFKPDVTVVMSYMINGKQANHDKGALVHRVEKEK